MGLITVTNGNPIYATDTSQCTNVLQRASGQQEIGKYVLAGNSYATNAAVSMELNSLSRTSIPVSVSIDTADVAPSHLASVLADTLTSGGFHLYGFGTGAYTDCVAAGNYTLQF